jgi:hypothetical protein
MDSSPTQQQSQQQKQSERLFFGSLELEEKQRLEKVRIRKLSKQSILHFKTTRL